MIEFMSQIVEAQTSFPVLDPMHDQHDGEIRHDQIHVALRQIVIQRLKIEGAVGVCGTKTQLHLHGNGDLEMIT